jgi:hypothetical protein
VRNIRVFFRKCNVETGSAMVSGGVSRHQTGWSTVFCERDSRPNEVHNVDKFVQEYTASQARRQYA